MPLQAIKNLFDLSEPRNLILHMTWFAFFLTFAIWFGHAPLMIYIKSSFGLTDQQVKILLIVNVAFTIPARILVGMLVDSLGPRLVYSLLLFSGGLLCVAFASANNYEQLTVFRFLLGFIGAGFVIGIRLVAEWFPPRDIGLAEGIYGGWGNFGAAAAALLLPLLSAAFGGESGWRWALVSLGIFTSGYGLIFFRYVRNTPSYQHFNKPRKSSVLEVSSWRDLYLLLAMNIPMYLALGALAWKLSPAGVNLLSLSSLYILWLLLTLLFLIQSRQILLVNSRHLKRGIVQEQIWSFHQVAILNWSYFVSFGSELAVVSMLPLFFMETFPNLHPAVASILASFFAFMNLVARPAGGFLSDRCGRGFMLRLLMAGVCCGYLCLSMVNSQWWVAAVVALCLICSLFVQATCGAVFAVVPLIKRSATGQIAGMTGAYGNVGGVFFLTLLSMFDYHTFFLCIAGTAALVFGICFFVADPKESQHQPAQDPYAALG